MEEKNSKIEDSELIHVSGGENEKVYIPDYHQGIDLNACTGCGY